jgi:hypothetical protein
MMRYSEACPIFGSDKMVVTGLGMGDDVGKLQGSG